MIILYELVSFIFIWSLLGFIVSRIAKRNDIADLLWPLGFLTISLLHIDLGSGTDLRSIIIFSFVCFWSLRLTSLFIFRLSQKEEDQRYKNWRNDWGKSEPIYSFLKIYLLQTAIMVVVSFPIIYIGYYPQSETTYWDFLGAIFAVLGIMIESVADKQLFDFKNKSSKESILDQGLWSLCRHPNYLGEILFWWGIFFFSISVNNSFVTIISPILITFLLTKVSGSPMLEKLLEKKGESFKIYLNKVPRSIIPFTLKDILTFLVLVFFY